MPDFSDIDILLAEDTATDAEMTIRALRRKGLANQLIWVKDGSEALDFLFYRNGFAQRESRQPKLVLLDLKMPKVNGIDVLRKLKEDPVLFMIPVVMLTSSAEERDIGDSYSLGANSFIVKPVDSAEFERVVCEAGIYWMEINRSSA